MKLKHYLAAAALALTAFSGLASADVVYLDVTFTATDFSIYPAGGTVPEPTVTGEFQITFDTTQTYTDSTLGISLENLNITLGSALGFDYSPTGPNAGILYVGGLAGGGADSVYIFPTPVNDDFYLQIDNIATTPSFDQLGYTQVASGDYFYYDISGLNEGTVSVTNVGTPEPAPVALLGLGLLAVATLRRRRAR
jgi:MYXO-CTERM domain-containing protein